VGEGRPDTFWAEQAETLHWFRRWDTVLDWSGAPTAKWFVGATTNASYNCLDRHLAERGNKAAIIWEGEPATRRALTYRQLPPRSVQVRQRPKALGVGKGDRVTIYMPMVPEAAVAMLACARIGAMQLGGVSGFSPTPSPTATTTRSRNWSITADGGWRRGKVVAAQGQRRAPRWRSRRASRSASC
jgi:acetyl-CoA synthetase